MSRARSITIDGTKHWFDTARNNRKATDTQLELLATVNQVDLEDLLEANPTQGYVLFCLRESLGQGIPIEVLQRRQRWREQRQVAPACRICGKQGDSTKHHFVNKWILKELDGYQAKWANRRRNCIPVCIDCHRDLHDRSNGPVSIVGFLTDKERAYADEALSALAEERPKLLILLARGDSSVYEACLVKDWLAGNFGVIQAKEGEPCQGSSVRQAA
jgi:hypothetical protein